MPIFKITNSKPEAAEQTTPVITANNDEENIDKKEKNKSVYLAGPLSECYTQALLDVFKKDKVSAESTIFQVMQADGSSLQELNADSEDAAFIYLTDDEHLKEDSVDDVFKNVNIALDNKNNAVSIECSSNRISNKYFIIEEYVTKENGNFIRTKQGTLDFIIKKLC